MVDGEFMRVGIFHYDQKIFMISFIFVIIDILESFYKSVSKWKKSRKSEKSKLTLPTCIHEQNQYFMKHSKNFPMRVTRENHDLKSKKCSMKKKWL